MRGDLGRPMNGAAYQPGGGPPAPWQAGAAHPLGRRAGRSGPPSATGKRRQVTKTSGSEGNPRWARNDTHVTYVSGGNLFIMAVDGSDTLVTQLTDVTQRRPEPRLTDNGRAMEGIVEYHGGALLPMVATRRVQPVVPR